MKYKDVLRNSLYLDEELQDYFNEMSKNGWRLDFVGYYYRFIKDPMNLHHRVWIHPWTKKSSTASFPELYDQAEKIYHQRLVQYAHLQHSGFPQKETARFLSAYGNLSFLSGLPCDE